LPAPEAQASGNMPEPSSRAVIQNSHLRRSKTARADQNPLSSIPCGMTAVVVVDQKQALRPLTPNRVNEADQRGTESTPPLKQDGAANRTRASGRFDEDGDRCPGVIGTDMNISTPITTTAKQAVEHQVGGGPLLAEFELFPP